MSQWNFTVVGGSLVKTLVNPEDYVAPRSKSYTAPKFDIAVNKITIFEQGQYDSTILFHEFNEIDGVAPTDLQDAYDKLLALIPTSSGGGSGTQYNNVDAYDEDTTLPLTFGAGTIHSFSIVAKTGNTIITINNEETIVVEGQSTTITASGLIAEEVSIDSTTGTFLATTLS
jgi:hypothetical protein